MANKKINEAYAHPEKLRQIEGLRMKAQAVSDFIRQQKLKGKPLPADDSYHKRLEQLRAQIQQLKDAGAYDTVKEDISFRSFLDEAIKVGSRVKFKRPQTFQHKGKFIRGEIEEVGRVIHDHGDGRYNVDVNTPHRKRKSWPYTLHKDKLSLYEAKTGELKVGSRVELDDGERGIVSQLQQSNKNFVKENLNESTQEHSARQLSHSAQAQRHQSEMIKIANSAGGLHKGLDKHQKARFDAHDRAMKAHRAAKDAHETAYNHHKAGTKEAAHYSKVAKSHTKSAAEASKAAFG